MHVRIGFVLELAREKPAVRLRKLDSLFDHRHGSTCSRRQHHARAEETHELAALDAELFGHGDNEWIAFRGADHCKPDAGVATARLDDGLSRLELTRALRSFDDCQ